MIEKGPISIQNSPYRTPLAVIILFILAVIHVTHVFFLSHLFFSLIFMNSNKTIPCKRYNCFSLFYSLITSYKLVFDLREFKFLELSIKDFTKFVIR